MDAAFHNCHSTVDYGEVLNLRVIFICYNMLHLESISSYPWLHCCHSLCVSLIRHNNRADEINLAFHAHWKDPICDKYVLFPEVLKLFTTLAIGSKPNFHFSSAVLA